MSDPNHSPQRGPPWIPRRAISITLIEIEASFEHSNSQSPASSATGVPMDISHHTSTTTPALAAPFFPLGPQPKGLGEQFQKNQDEILNQVIAYNNSQQNEPMVQRGDNPPLQGPDGHLPKRLILVRYGNQTLPAHVNARMVEVPAHLDIQHINPAVDYSLHTEYSSKPRRFDSPLLEGLDSLKVSHRNGVPEQWTSVAWAREYAVLVKRLVAGGLPPSQIEIHPPFCSSAATTGVFLERYEAFEEAIQAGYPGCGIVMENRSGTKHPHKFLMSDSGSILAMGQALQQTNLKLGIALDVPQMFTAAYGSKHAVGLEAVMLLSQLMPIHDRIHTLHLWGRAAGGGAHGGGLDGLFDLKTDTKRACMQALRDLISDGDSRYLVLEVRRATDVAGIIQDLEDAGMVIESTL